MPEAIERLLREPEVKAVTGLSRTVRWELEKAGKFPKRRIISSRLSGYLASEVEAWVRSRPVSTYKAPEACLRARGLDLPKAA